MPAAANAKAKAEAKSPTPARRAQRPDGEATRQRLVETAGQVFAERGYAEATSKEICQRAGVLLREVMTPSAALPALIEKAVRPKARFLRGLVAGVMRLPPNHPSVQRGLVFSLLPCLAIVVMPKEVPARLLPALARDSGGLADELMRH